MARRSERREPKGDVDRALSVSRLTIPGLAFAILIGVIVAHFLTQQPEGGRGTSFGDLGLKIGVGKCKGWLELATTLGSCTHGPDPVPPDARPPEPQPPTPPPSTQPGRGCPDDDAGDARLQVLYVHASSTPSRLADFKGTIQRAVESANDIYKSSADELGGYRSLRLVRAADCTIDVTDVVLPDGSLDNIDRAWVAVSQAGYRQRNRLYVGFYEANRLCGIANMAVDESTGSTSEQTVGPRHSRMDVNCWDGHSTAHEIGHMLGAVGNGAPNTNDNGHCDDENDVMCYQEKGFPEMRIVCPDPGAEQRLDCRHDDYFSLAPEPGSYLATHWNIADSPFLIKERP